MTDTIAPEIRARVLREVASDLRDGKLRPFYYGGDMRLADRLIEMAKYIDCGIAPASEEVTP